MPWSYSIDSERNVVFTTGTGVLTEQELLGGLRSLYADPKFHPDHRGLFDYREVETLQVSNDLMASLAASRKYSARSRTAFLVNGPLAYGLGRLYQTWVQDGQVKIANERAEAVAWLNEGLPPEKHIT